MLTGRYSFLFNLRVELLLVEQSLVLSILCRFSFLIRIDFYVSFHLLYNILLDLLFPLFYTIFFVLFQVPNYLFSAIMVLNNCFSSLNINNTSYVQLKKEDGRRIHFPATFQTPTTLLCPFSPRLRPGRR